jgi:sulfite oxidase
MHREGQHMFDAMPQYVAAPGSRTLPDPALNIEPPVTALDAPLTPPGVLFVRNNGTLPEAVPGWEISVEGLVERPLRLSLAALREAFPQACVTAVLECAGNGRSGFDPAAQGLPWGHAAVGCARWSGVRLADVLRAAGPRPAAAHLGFESPDHVIGKPGVAALSRGIPLAKAMAEETLLAFAMNDAPLAPLHGAPLRLVVPGFPGSAWQKWVTRILVLEHEHQGAKMTGLDYRMPRRPVAPGETPDPAIFDTITDMPVKSIITTPAEGFSARRRLRVEGWAWSGHTPLSHVEVSADGGATWQPATLAPAEHRWAWRRFHADLAPHPGPVTLAARATDTAGRSQPERAPWNPRGYLNNAWHRVQGRGD